MYMPILVITRMPTLVPTSKPTIHPSGPTISPTYEPTLAPTPDPLCCAHMSYYQESNWQSCIQASDTSVNFATNCSTCLAYQCIDWTTGSIGMRLREQTYSTTTRDNVYFAVGSYGTDNARAGNCYRIKTDSIDRDIIMQVVTKDQFNSPTDIRIQQSNGGIGLSSSCSFDATSVPQYSSTILSWGDSSGGWSSPSQCDLLPDYPICGENHNDNLQDLCKWSFNKGFKKRSGVISNPVITSLCQVKCPSDLWLATGLHRSDEPTTSYTCPSTGGSIIPIGTMLQGYMDCNKPDYAFPYSINGKTYNGYSLVVPCRRDGYVRINSIPTPNPTTSPIYRPTKEPSFEPTYEPSFEPTSEITNKPSNKPSVKSTYQNTYTPTILIGTNSDQKQESVLVNPGLIAALSLGVLIAVILIIICYCEYWYGKDARIKRKEKQLKRLRQAEVYRELIIRSDRFDPIDQSDTGNRRGSSFLSSWFVRYTASNDTDTDTIL